MNYKKKRLDSRLRGNDNEIFSSLIKEECPMGGVFLLTPSRSERWSEVNPGKDNKIYTK